VKEECFSGFYDPEKSDYVLKNLWILDSGTIIHISHELHRFVNFVKAPKGDRIITGDGEVPIFGYGDVWIIMTYKTTQRRVLLKRVAYCQGFTTNLVTWDLKKKGWKWNTDVVVLWRPSPSSEEKVNFASLTVRAGQRVIEGNETEPSFRGNGTPYAFSTKRARLLRRSARKLQQVSSATGYLWHLRMGHAGPEAIHHLETHCRGAKVTSRGPSTKECIGYARAKVKNLISRRRPDYIYTTLFQKVHINWFNVAEGIDGTERVMFIICEATGMIMSYFFTSRGESGSLEALISCSKWLRERYNLRISVICSDNELIKGNATKAWLEKSGITFEPSPPYIQDLNNVAERMGGVIFHKS
jgi:hypothetical protein